MPNLYATIGHSPAALRGLLALEESLATGTLSPREAELVKLHVSELNGCGYCLSAHSLVAARLGLSPDEVAAARAGHARTLREVAILALVRREASRAVIAVRGGAPGSSGHDA